MIFSDFITEQLRGRPADGGLVPLLVAIETACVEIAAAVARVGLDTAPSAADSAINVHGETQKPLDLLSNEIMLRQCAASGQLSGMASEELEQPYPIPPEFERGPYFLVFDPLDGSGGIEIAMTVGTIFSILRAPDGRAEPATADFLQPGSRQVAAGYALYGPVTMLVLTLGNGVHGFTLDRETGSFRLTHPDLRMPAATREFAVNASNARFWEPPVRRYVEECVAGKAGPRGGDFNMRWIACMVAEVHRILIRGGLFMYPRDTRDPAKPGRLRLMYEANPMAMLVEQAGGAASTGRARLLDVIPDQLHQRIAVILGSHTEVELLERYHTLHDRGELEPFQSPLFNERGLFRAS